jgi:malate dehydrogenase (oxaloacetate-decarboxylating)
MNYEEKTDKQGQKYLEVRQTGFNLMRNPLLNKGSAFSEDERKSLNLQGLLPPAMSNLATQRERSYKVFQGKTTAREKYIYLRELQDSNETLYYSLLAAHITEMMPIVYTPTVGEGCQAYSLIYRRPRGLFLALPDKDHLERIFAHAQFDGVEAIVVSDGERILGLGDQGVGGMGIPIGKLALYSACAGIHPAATLPILLDVGTNNPELLSDPLYLGWRHARIRGQEYDDFIDAFVSAVKKRWPKVLLQWEDFAQQNANPILQRYRKQLCTFNDDIQGTAAIATATLLAAVQATGAQLKDQIIAVVGGGSAGCGISHLIMQAMINAGLSETEARTRFFLIDAHGLLTDKMTDLQDFQKPFAQAMTGLAHWEVQTPGKLGLVEVIKNAKPTVLLGVSGQPGLFTEEAVRLMAAQVKRPVILPLSNPTSRCEATPSDLMAWTQGTAVIGTGSPFPDIIRNGKPFRVDQTNNAYIFPGMGLGIIAVGANQVSDGMFMAAAEALASLSPAKRDPLANLLPPLAEIRTVSRAVAIATAMQAIKEGLAAPQTLEVVTKAIDAKMWTPDYLPYMKHQHTD